MKFYLNLVVILLLFHIFATKIYAKEQTMAHPIGTANVDLQLFFPFAEIPVKDTTVSRPSTVLLDVPLISQMPELPRGCEVTSLAMLLRYKGIAIDKLTLAKEIKKDPTPYRRSGSAIYFGNPHYGFVGSMTSFREPGFGVFHGPVYELANRYLSGNAINLTGSSFETILEHLGQNKPVWVISTSTFDRVPEQYWQTWQTPHGPISITYKEHSVLLTGYDNQFVYFNDPLANIKNRKVPMASFIRGWEQFGKQAITYK
ncbi:MAG: C39 family peptidase [Ectobacillus sp.]